jgi:hypothetical protein
MSTNNFRTQIIHLNSRNRLGGSISNYYVDFKNVLFSLQSPGLIRVEPLQAVIMRSWNSVDVPNNIFTISNDTTTNQYTIPPGNYNVKTFLIFLQKLLPDFTLAWKLETNKYYIQPPNDNMTYTFSFYNNSSYLFGFNPEDTPSFSYSNTLYSRIPINMNHSNVILVHTNLEKAKYTSIDNLISSDVVESNILLKIPINCAPYDTLIWRSNSENVVTYDLNCIHINRLNIWLTNEYGEQINLFHDWTLSLKVIYMEGVIENNENQTTLQLNRMQDYLHYLVLNKKTKKSS